MLVIDEAPQIRGQLDMAALTALGRSAAVSTVLGMQDVMQFDDESERSAILGNCATFVARGTNAQSAEYLGSDSARGPSQ